MAAAPVRVLVVDDHPLFAKTIEAVLAGDGAIELVGSADCGEAGIELAEELRPDVILMDLEMPGIGGLEATRRIHADGGALVLVLTGALDASEELARAAGADGFLTKDRLLSDLRAAILALAPR